MAPAWGYFAHWKYVLLMIRDQLQPIAENIHSEERKHGGDVCLNGARAARRYWEKLKFEGD
jgi:hypothetical protein